MLEENKLLRIEVKNLKDEVEELAVKRVKTETEAYTSDVSSVCLVLLLGS